MRSAISCCAALALVVLFRLAAADTTWEGRQLSEYLDFLNDQGSRIIYTSDLVADDMRLSSEPGGDHSPEGLTGLLHGFGLTVMDGPAGSLIVVQLPPEVAAAAQVAEPESVAIPEIVVTSSLRRSGSRDIRIASCPARWRPPRPARKTRQGPAPQCRKLQIACRDLRASITGCQRAYRSMTILSA